MFLLEPERTPYDLNWRMFGIPVRVHPLFWLFSAILGWSAMEDGFIYLVAWIGCVFLSILIHELGHVFAGRAFGSEGHIVLYSFGGLAIGSNSLSSRWQRIAVSFAGPWAGFVFIGLVVWLLSFFDPGTFGLLVATIKVRLGLPIAVTDFRGVPQLSALGISVVFDLFWINVLWGLLNLLPIWPLDGGQISRELFEGYMRGGNGIRASLAVSGAVAALLAINSLAATYGQALLPFLQLRGMYMVIFFGLLAFSSFQAMQQVQTSRPWREDYPSWDRDRDYWDRDRDRWDR